MIALTHLPSPHMEACERTFVAREPIDYRRACQQHDAYVATLESCGIDVRKLNTNPQFPDSTFIEDTAILLDEVAIITSMGAASRRGEPAGIEPALREYRSIEKIELPASIDGGDVLRVGRTLFVGRSVRTNAAGIAALASIAKRHGYDIIAVPVTGCLHFKSACTALPDGRLLMNPQWLDLSPLGNWPRVEVPVTDPHGANVLLAGETVVAPASHGETTERIRGLGFAVKTVDLSEFAKAEGCVTCLSLLFD